MCAFLKISKEGIQTSLAFFGTNKSTVIDRILQEYAEPILEEQGEQPGTWFRIATDVSFAHSSLPVPTENWLNVVTKKFFGTNRLPKSFPFLLKHRSIKPTDLELLRKLACLGVLGRGLRFSSDEGGSATRRWRQRERLPLRVHRQLQESR